MTFILFCFCIVVVVIAVYICLAYYKNLKTTRDQNVTNIEGLVVPSELCEPCKHRSQDRNAEYFCKDCEEFLCSECRVKDAKNHSVILASDQIQRETETKRYCGICMENDEMNEAVAICLDCNEQKILCSDCVKDHTSFKKTRKHRIEHSLAKYHGADVTISNTISSEPKLREESEKPQEEPMGISMSGQNAEPTGQANTDNLVQIQEDVLVNPVQSRSGFHLETVERKNEENEDVMMLQNPEPTGQANTDNLVQIQEDVLVNLVESRSDFHLETMETKKDGNKDVMGISMSGQNAEPTGQANTDNLVQIQEDALVNPVDLRNEFHLETVETKKEGDEDVPGKPTIDGVEKADSVQLMWKPPRSLYNEHQYQIRYKTTAPSDKWKFYQETFGETTVVLEKLKSDSTFIFQVRMVNNDKEGPYSSQSDHISTKQSAAIRLKDFTQRIENSESIIDKRKLLLEESMQARNETAKMRQFYLGSLDITNCTEKTIMLVGATGSGKSTLVDGIINYILGVNWDDPFRFTLIDLEDDEKKVIKNQAISQTQWITTYCINPSDGSRLDYRLNIIDTPGFGDTRGLERDKQIVEQIRKLFSASDGTGVVFLDAVCFITKAPDARLTPTQNYIFNAILSLFGQDIADNIKILITFADGKTPPVLAALKQAKLPHEPFFPFNNSSLFSDNSGPNMSPLSPMFWEMGCNSFKAFFDHLMTMQTKSLKQTNEVLLKRQQMEMTIENLTPLVKNGLNKMEVLNVEIKIIEQHKTEIEANIDFHYTVTETRQVKHDLPRGQHVTNCVHCHFTCHRHCWIPRDEDKDGCAAMDDNGNCTQCVKKCHWTEHANTPYIFEYEEVQVKKTYREKEEKYRKAKGAKTSHVEVMQGMMEDLLKLQNDILTGMNIVAECSNVLKEIALRPNPLSVKEHIDLLIESEKQEKRKGFQSRIKSLMECRQKCEIGDAVKRLQEDFQTTIGKAENIESVKKTFLQRCMFWK